MSAENASAALKSQMSLQEAQQILGVDKNVTLDQVRKVRHSPASEMPATL